MNDSQSKQGLVGRSSGAFLSAVIAIAATGYFVGLSDGVPREDFSAGAQSLIANQSSSHHAGPTAVLPASVYGEMRRASTGPTSRWNPGIDQIPQPVFDLFAEVKPNPEDKERSTRTRASRRAFNGAPPVIPHAVERTADGACYACHGQGLRIGERVANRMSHGFLANCTQCHAPPPPKPFADTDAAVANDFVGLPAPLKGERAFPGAPPTIPHSTWMREQCLACHGREAGWVGLESTHPWRINCQQCHAPSAKLEQAMTVDNVGFLPAPTVKQP